MSGKKLRSGKGVKLVALATVAAYGALGRMDALAQQAGEVKGTPTAAELTVRRFGIAAGSLDTLGNLFYMQATRVGRLDVAAIVCSMYPAGTILLAAIVLREWPTARQFMGIALALAAVGLLSV